jgi:protein-disulfide isomerase
LPGFINVYNKYRSQDVEFLGISLDFNFDIDDLAEVIADWGINYQIILDDGYLIQSFGGFNGVPTTFIIGKDFKFKTRHAGYINETDLEKLIQAEL